MNHKQTRTKMAFELILFVCVLLVSACKSPFGKALSIALENGKTEEDGAYGIGEPFRPAGTVTFRDGPVAIADIPAESIH
jgi:hypothetical protein